MRSLAAENPAVGGEVIPAPPSADPIGLSTARAGVTHCGRHSLPYGLMPVRPIRPLLSVRRGREAPEDHPSGTRLQDALDHNVGFLADHRAAVFAHHHRPVVEVAHALAGSLARLDDLDGQPLAGQIARL